jgi:hypothetical protein
MSATVPMSRRSFLQRGVLLAAAPYALGAIVPPPPARAARAARASADPAAAARERYFRFCDELMPHVDGGWSAQRGYYAGGDPGETMSNASLLVVHATMARFRRDGAARQDERARSIALRLCLGPPWRAPRRTRNGDQSHDFGWQSTFEGTGFQHVVVDTAVVRGLASAYHARDDLGLPDATVLAIRDRLERCAYGTFYEFPQVRLNQINWPIEIYAHTASVLGEAHLLQHDARLQLGRFADHLTRRAPGDRTPYTGPGYHFHYLPQNNATTPANVDNAEYANLVCGAIAYYEQARRAGMQELTASQLERMQAWVERVLCGYWTHAGYVNWDSGLGFHRWHQTKKLALCQEALLGIAAAPRFQRTPRYGAWAKHLFDRGLAWYAEQVARAGTLPPPVSFGVPSDAASGDQRLTASRMMANACRAVVFGLDGVAGTAPPALYAYDPDIGRLAVTTPTYNTAIVAVNQGAFPYGGVEPARLFDGAQRPVANVGGAGDACFGIVVRDHRAKRTTASQRGRPRADLAHPPLRLLRAPRGTSAHPIAYPQHAYAGPFEDIEAVGTTHGRSAIVESRHRFRPEFIESTWSIRPRPGAHGEHTIHAQFPSWGASTTITAVLHDGTRHVLGAAPIALRDIAWFHVLGPDGGYVVVLRSSRLPGRARLLHPRAQSSQPHPGPTLALELLTRARLRPRTLSVRYAPASDPPTATVIANRLGGPRHA